MRITKTNRLHFFVMLSFTATAVVAPLSAFTGNDYREAAWLTLRFFGAQRCGNTGNWALAGHDQAKGGEVCHTRDGETAGADLSGGWHDCGDHWKVCFTQGFAAYTLLKAYDVFPAGFQDMYKQRYQYTETMPPQGGGDGIPDVINEAKVATDYFIKAIPNETTFYAECGNPDYDHKEWKTSAFQSLNPVDKGGDPRPVVKLTDKAGASCAQFVAALALMARLAPRFGMKAYADSCKAAALRGYPYAKAHASAQYQNGGYYQESQEGSDDLIVASTELFFLTGDETFKNDAVSFIKGKWESGWAYSWNSLWEAAYYNLLRIDPTANNQGGKTVMTLFRGSYTTALSKKNSAGLCFYENWGSCRYAGGAAFAMMLFYDIAKSTDSAAAKKALELARGQADYCMGDNEFKRAFIHGFGTNSWDKVHHRNAQGIDHNPPDAEKESTPFKFKRSGALIGGPTGVNTYVNSVVNYTCTESGCDYNAGITGALAGLISILAPYQVINGVKETPGPPDAPFTAPRTIRSVRVSYVKNQGGPGLRIEYELAAASPVTITIYNSRAQAVASSRGGFMAKGVHRFVWNGVSPGSGFYFCDLTAGPCSVVKPFTLTQ